MRDSKVEYDKSNIDELGYETDNKFLSTQFGFELLENNNKNNFKTYYNKYDRQYDEKGIFDYYDSEAIGFKYDKNNVITENLSYGLGTEYRYDWAEFINNGSYTASTKGNYDNVSVYGNIGYLISKYFSLLSF